MKGLSHRSSISHHFINNIMRASEEIKLKGEKKTILLILLMADFPHI